MKNLMEYMCHRELELFYNIHVYIHKYKYLCLFNFFTIKKHFWSCIFKAFNLIYNACQSTFKIINTHETMHLGIKIKKMYKPVKSLQKAYY